jgi:glutamine cyclotransferase
MTVKIYQSDGTEKIWKTNPETQKMSYIMSILEAKIKAINELEWINGKFYTQCLAERCIAVVNPTMEP